MRSQDPDARLLTTDDVAAFRAVALRNSSDPTYEGYNVPNVPPGARRILDVGCHAGHLLEALRLPEVCELFGCDINKEAVELARTCLPRAKFSLAKAEALPYDDSYFDFVYARSALYAFEIPRALREFNRVLKPAGRLWISLHRWKDIRFILKGTVGRAPLKTIVFASYIAMNSALFHCTGQLVRYPLNRSRMMTFQTETRMRHELQKAGFGAIRVLDTKFFVIEADKLGGDGASALVPLEKERDLRLPLTPEASEDRLVFHD